MRWGRERGKLTWSECRGEEGDEDADERKLRGSRRAIVERSSGTTSRDDVLADTHTKRADQQHRTTAELVDGVETRQGGDDVDDVGDDGQDKRVWKRLLAGEVRGAVVEDEVDADELL